MNRIVVFAITILLLVFFPLQYLSVATSESQLADSNLQYRVTVSVNGVSGSYKLIFNVTRVAGSHGSGKFIFNYTVEYLSGVIPSKTQFSAGEEMPQFYELVFMDKAFASYLNKKPIAGSMERSVKECLFYINTTDALNSLNNAPGLKILKFLNTSSGRIVVVGLKEKMLGQALIAFDYNTGVLVYLRISTLNKTKEVSVELIKSYLPNGYKVPCAESISSELEELWSNLSRIQVSVSPPSPPITTISVTTTAVKTTVEVVRETITVTVTKTTTLTSTTTVTKTSVVEKTNVKVTALSSIIAAIIAAAASIAIYRSSRK